MGGRLIVVICVCLGVYDKHLLLGHRCVSDNPFLRLRMKLFLDIQLFSWVNHMFRTFLPIRYRPINTYR